MKKFFILAVSLFSSIMVNAQARYVDLWGSYNYSAKKKVIKGDSVLYLAKSTEEETYHVYKKGKMIDILSRKYNSYSVDKKRLQEKNGKFYIGNYVVLLDSTLMEEIRSFYGSHLSHNSHVSHNSHASHYSSSF